MSRTKEDSSQVITRIVERFNARSRKDITSWRTALKLAENPERPNRLLLYNLYDELLLDAHFYGVFNHGLCDALFAEEFKINSITDGETNDELTDFLKSDWFYKLLRYALESAPISHSLIQVGDLVPHPLNPSRQIVQSVDLIPRRHVIPEFGEIRREQTDERGFPYRDTALMDYLIEVGDPKSLGYLNQAAPLILWKKNAVAAWSEYCDIFGMPIRVGKTNTRQIKDMNRMEDALRDMSKAAYAVFNEGESIEFIESTKGDAYKVYDMLISRQNSEISKLVLGQTLTTDTGASGTRAQGEVHERGHANVINSYKRMLASMVNDQLLPLLTRRGINFQGYQFEYVQQKDLAAVWTRTEGLLDHFDVDPAWVKDTFGIPVELKKAMTNDLELSRKKKRYS